MIEVRIAKFPNLNAGNVMDKQMEIKLSKITIFQRKIKENPMQNPCKIPANHCIDLVVNVPVSVPWHQIAYSLRDEIKKNIDKPIKNDSLLPSLIPYNL